VSRNSSRMTLYFELSCQRFLLLGNDDNFRVANCRCSRGSHRKHNVSSPAVISLRNIPPLSGLVIRSLQVFKQSSCWFLVARGHVEHCAGQHDMFTSSDRILWQEPRLIPPAAAAAASSTIWEKLACTNVAIFLDLQFSSGCPWPTSMSSKNGVFWDVRPCGSCKNRRIPSISSQCASVASCSLCCS
jgi:hypothetical protein